MSWFSWNSHVWCGSTPEWTLLFLETNSPIEPWGKMCPKTGFPAFIQPYGCFYYASIKAGTDYGTYSAAQPDAAAKNMVFTSVDSQRICYEYVPRQSCIAVEQTKNCRFPGRTQRHSLPQNASSAQPQCQFVPQAFFRKLSNIMFVAVPQNTFDSLYRPLCHSRLAHLFSMFFQYQWRCLCFLPMLSPSRCLVGIGDPLSQVSQHSSYEPWEWRLFCG